MLRLRRYRAFLIFAAILVFAIVRLTYQKDWVPDASSAEIFVHPDRPPPKENEPAGSEPVKPAPAVPLKEKATEAATSRIAQKQPPISTSTESVHASQAVVPSTKSSPAATVQSVPHVVLPDRKIPPPTKVIYGDEDESQIDIHPVGPPSRQDLPAFSAAPTTIHWEKQVEHFPVRTESIIHLPTGKPVKIPKIQHAFNDETTDAKITREKRQAKVRDQFKKAWTGYKQNAWLHDELSPVSGKFRDPFCGWAATLVDTLDTLWIMGLQEEFEEAARAVDLIDFTTSPRGDIPVFETTIRYLGGLLAAYDVSGGQYKNLLDKAVELADILMGAFDTPNRMPVLFYRWKPAFASQPHRASQRSNLAELGSLSMEFTRLAQLTHEPRYYDAVARVTNALSEWQDRGTKLGGVFPGDVDASGCNRTVPLNIPESVSRGRGPALNAGKSSEEPLGYEPNTVKTVAEPKPRKKPTKEGPGTLKMDVTPGEPSKARIIGWDDEDNKKEKRTPAKRDLDDLNADPNSTASLPATTEPENDDTLANVTDFLPAKKGLNDDITLHDSGATATPINPITGLPLDLNAARAKVDTSVGEWDCTPQGLQPSNQYGMNNFGMGGGQDSTYEYFPKEYLLLGGLEEQYRKMYLKTIHEVKKWMLYRPMIPGSRDILFSGAVTTSGDPENDVKLKPEVEHLTCFIGGMIGMAAKIFELDSDLEIAKKLTNGCVWAYSMTPSGIMPESSTVMPCESTEHCTWNETAYWNYLDPAADYRDEMLEEYIANKAAREAEVEAARVSALAKAEATSAEEAGKNIALDEDMIPGEISPPSNSTNTPLGSDALKKDTPASLQKRQTQSSPKEEVPLPITHDFRDDVPERKAKSGFAQPPSGELQDVSSPAETTPTPTDKKSKSTEDELRDISIGGHKAEVPLTGGSTAGEVLPDPQRPLSHKEWVEARIKQEALPPGFVTIRGRKYILRPEAIESVWYMYRITGDKTWQDKGWKMFESIIKATSVQYGHSAIYDVTLDKPYQIDEMESFWLAETLKYFYLLYSTPDTISLDEWVLNTEAHPFKRPV